MVAHITHQLILFLLLPLLLTTGSTATNCTCSPFSGNTGSCCNHNNFCKHLSSSLTCENDTPVCCTSDFSSHCCPLHSACSQGCRNSLLGSCRCIPLRSSKFNESDALFSLTYVAASQCTPESGLNNSWSCTACSTKEPLENVIVVQESGHQTLVGYNRKHNVIVVALRGSLSIQDWISDLKAAVMVNLPNAVAKGCTNECQVAEGFLESTSSLQLGIQQSVTKILALHPECQEVVVTGHSLGAAMASLLLANNTAAPAISFGHLVRRPIYTFGQPRVGNKAYANWMRKIFPKNDWYRVVHHDDPVPHLPTASMGYYHQETEVWYSESGLGLGQYEVCNSSGEDGQCSAGTMLSGEITDHLTYLTHPVNNCKPF